MMYQIAHSQDMSRLARLEACALSSNAPGRSTESTWFAFSYFPFWVLLPRDVSASTVGAGAKMVGAGAGTLSLNCGAPGDAMWPRQIGRAAASRPGARNQGWLCDPADTTRRATAAVARASAAAIIPTVVTQRLPPKNMSAMGSDYAHRRR